MAPLALIQEALLKAVTVPLIGLSGNPADPANIRIDFAPEATTEQRQAARAWLDALDPATIHTPDITGFFQALGDAISLGTLPADFYLLGQILKDQPDLSKQQLLLARFATNPVYTPELKAALNALMAQYHLQLPPV